MRTALVALLLSVSLAGCAHLPASGTIKTMNSLAIREHSDLMPDFWVIAGDNHAKELKLLVEWAQRRYIRVGFVPNLSVNGQSLMGFTKRTEAGPVFVLINNSVPVNTQLYTLVHELAHVYHAGNMSTEAGEVFAELVASQACAKIGLDGMGETAKYLSEQATVEFQWRATLSFYREVDAVALMLAQGMRGAN